MKLPVLLLSAATLTLVAGGTRAKPQPQRHHRNVVALGNRQVDLGAAGPSGSSASGPASPTPSPSSSQAAVSSSSSSSGHSAASTVTGTGMATTGSVKTSIPTPVVSVPPGGQNGVPPLSLISFGMSTGTPSPVASSYVPGATPPISGAPVLPAACTFPLVHFVCVHAYFRLLVVFHPADWPTQDRVPDTCESFLLWLWCSCECRGF